MRREKFASTNQKQHPDLGSDASSVWNFYSRFSDRRHFAWKTAIASHNVGFFLRPLDLFVTLILDLNGIGV